MTYAELITYAEKQFDEITSKQTPIILKQDSPELKLLERIRDEAHRTAISFHRKTRSKKMFTQLKLDSIPKT